MSNTTTVQTKIHHLHGHPFLDAILAAIKSREPLTTACDAYSVMHYADHHASVSDDVREWATAEFYRLGGHSGMNREKYGQ